MRYGGRGNSWGDKQIKQRKYSAGGHLMSPEIKPHFVGQLMVVWVCVCVWLPNLKFVVDGQRPRLSHCIYQNAVSCPFCNMPKEVQRKNQTPTHKYTHSLAHSYMYVLYFFGMWEGGLVKGSSSCYFWFDEFAQMFCFIKFLRKCATRAYE